MRTLVAPTETLRAPITQEARVVLCPLGMKVNPARLDMNVAEFVADAEAKQAPAPVFIPDISAPLQHGSSIVREVQVLVPPSGRTFWALDVLPEVIGPNRLYTLPPTFAGQTVIYSLAPWQWLVGATDVGSVACGLIVHYVEATAALMAFKKATP